MFNGRNHQKTGYQKFFDDIPGGILICLDDDQFTIVEANKGFYDLFGYTRRELEEQFSNQYIQIIYPDDREKIKDEVHQAKKAGHFSLNYRIICKDRVVKWVVGNYKIIEEKQIRKFICMMMDITTIYVVKEQLCLSLEKHKIVTDQTTDIIFEWDLETDLLEFTANWEKKFGYAPFNKKVTTDLLKARCIPESDLPILDGLIQGIKNGAGYAAEEFRIKNREGKEIWCRVRVTVQYDSERKPVKAVGVISDIDKEKRMIDSLRRRAESDALTGLYNREKMEVQLKRYLGKDPEGMSALLMVDIDNFKKINDTKGHLFGDTVLSEMATGMKRSIRKSDMIARIGGDEFVIFLKGISSRQQAEEKASQLLTMIRNLFSEEKQTAYITCSIGIAVYPENGKTFQELYHCADLALYDAKKQGKNQYRIFNPKKMALME